MPMSLTATAIFAALGAVTLSGMAWTPQAVADERIANKRIAGEGIPGGGVSASGKSTPRQPTPRLDSRALADRIDRREPAPASKGVMRFGDTEVRIGGRASVGYGYSSR